MTDFHLVVNDHDAMYMTELVRGHEEIHVYVEHLVGDPILADEGKDVGVGMQPLAVEQDIIGYYDNDDNNYSDDSEHDDHDGGEFYSIYDSDDMYANDQTFNNKDEPIEVDVEQVYAKRVGVGLVIEEVNANVPIEMAASQVGSRRVGKEPIIKHPPEVFNISDSSDSVGSGLEDDVELNHGVKDFVEDNSDNQDGKDDDDVVEPSQMGAGVMNSDIEGDELYSLVESSSNDELGYDSDNNSKDDKRINVGDGREQKKEVRKFPVFKPVAKAWHISFEKDMLFTTPKQFKEAIAKYAVHGG